MPAKRRRTAAPRHRSEPDRLARAVGVRVKALRNAQGFSFDAFVEETGLGRGYISELERGLVVPSLHALARLAHALEVTVADLVLGDSPRERIFSLTRSLSASDVARLLAAATRLAEATPKAPIARAAEPTSAPYGGSRERTR